MRPYERWDSPAATQGIGSRRRKGARRRIRLDVVAVAGPVRAHGHTVDMSFTGVLLRIDDPDRTDLLSLSSVQTFAERFLHSGFTLLFGGGVVRRRMRVVRTTFCPDARPMIACRFVSPLAKSECALLGLDPLKDLATTLIELEEREDDAYEFDPDDDG